jgi:hypothetical protein
MIDLAENAGAEFSWTKKWDVTLSDATCTYWEQKEELGKIKKYDMVFGADGVS